jgi:hypothetical protein
MHQQYNTIDYKVHSDRINAFLRAPSTSFPSNNIYGTGLFPLYIHTYYGGSGNAYIKSILETLKTYPAYSVDTAITSALPASFAQIFSQFWAYTYIPHITYSKYAITSGVNSWDNKPATTNFFSLTGLPTGQTSVDYLACRYIDFYAPNPGDYLSITVNVTSGTSTNLRNYLVLKTTGGSVIVTDISSGYYPATYSLFISSSYSYSDGSIAAINVGTSSGTINFTLNIW